MLCPPSAPPLRVQAPCRQCRRLHGCRSEWRRLLLPRAVRTCSVCAGRCIDGEAWRPDPQTPVFISRDLLCHPGLCSMSERKPLLLSCDQCRRVSVLLEGGLARAVHGSHVDRARVSCLLPRLPPPPGSAPPSPSCVLAQRWPAQRSPRSPSTPWPSMGCRSFPRTSVADLTVL